MSEKEGFKVAGYKVSRVYSANLEAMFSGSGS